MSVYKIQHKPTKRFLSSSSLAYFYVKYGEVNKGTVVKGGKVYVTRKGAENKLKYLDSDFEIYEIKE